ncbi:MAG: hypothetical protein RL215_2944 [Planctomycetota bacterium]
MLTGLVRIRWFASFRVALLVAASNLVTGATVHAQAPAPADTVALYKAGLFPDRVVLTWSDDPATTQAVTWRTSTEVTRAWAELTVADPGPALAASARQIEAKSEVQHTPTGPAHCHSVTFTALQPATLYAYRVGDGERWSEWFQFQTASAEPRPFSFIYFGDAQNDVRSMWSRVIRSAYRDAPRAAFMLHAGDLINTAETDSEWGEWFGAGAWLNGMLPSIPVAGNHEQAKMLDGTRQLSRHWRPQFTLPENGPKGLEESCYTLVYQGVRIIALNSNERHQEQAVWLDQVLSENREKWVVCSFHHPMFSTGKDRDNKELRAIWKPILDKHRVDLVLQGHDHTYGRTGLDTPVAGENSSSGANVHDTFTGTVYVVSVSGPKMYNLQRHPFMKRHAEDTQLYQIIHVDGDQLSFEAYTATGQLYDAFTLSKQANAANRLEDRIPDSPERLRPPVAAEAPRKAADALK